MTEDDNDLLSECLDLAKSILSSSYYENKGSWDTNKELLSALEEEVSSFIQISLVLQNSKLTQRQLTGNHLHMFYAVYCEMHRQDTTIFTDLDTARILEKYHSDLKYLEDNKEN